MKLSKVVNKNVRIGRINEGKMGQRKRRVGEWIDGRILYRSISYRRI
jgi:hypothetical protein